MFKILFVLVLTLNGYLFAHHVSDKNKVMIAYAEEWPPYSYRDKDGKMKGILIDIVNHLLNEKLHYKVEHGGFPWKRGQLLSENGIYDAIITYPSKQRKEKYYSTNEVVLELEWRGFTSIKSIKYLDILHLENPLVLKKGVLTFGSVLGDETTQGFLDNNNVNSTKFKNVDIGVKVLNEGRIDFFINSKLTTLNIIYKNKLENKIKIHSKIYKKVPFTFLLSKQSDMDKNLIIKLDNLISQMKKDGSFDELIKRIEQSELKKWKIK